MQEGHDSIQQGHDSILFSRGTNQQHKIQTCLLSSLTGQFVQVLIESAYFDAFVIGASGDEIPFSTPSDAIDGTTMMFRSFQQDLR